MEFSDKTARSVGAALGMGLLFAQNFAEFVGNAVMCDINKEMLTKCVDDIG